MTVGERLRAAKDAKGDTELEFGKRLVNSETGEPASQARVNDWLNGKALPSRAYYRSIGRVLGMSAQDVASTIGSERRSRSKGGNADRLDRLERDVAEVKKMLREIRASLAEDQ